MTDTKEISQEAARAMLAALYETHLQITYLHDRMGQVTASGNTVLARIQAAIALAEGRAS